MTQRDTQFRHSNRNNSYQRSERMFQTLQLSQFPFLGILGNLSYFRQNSRLVTVIQAVYEIQKIYIISSHEDITLISEIRQSSDLDQKNFPKIDMFRNRSSS